MYSTVSGNQVFHVLKYSVYDVSITDSELLTKKHDLLTAPDNAGPEERVQRHVSWNVWVEVSKSGVPDVTRIEIILAYSL